MGSSGSGSTDSGADGTDAPVSTGEKSESRPDTSEREDDLSTEELRRQVEEKYDFENFGPEDMAKMSGEEWDAAFDADSWITGEELLDRVEADLKQRVIDRDVFARIERHDDYLLAYSDTGFAVVYPDGSVQGEGTVLRDVKPTIALASMESYDVPDVPDGEVLPQPAEVPEGSGELGNTMLQIVGFIQIIAGLALVGAGLLFGFDPIPLVVGLIFLAVAFVLFFTVANARLSDRFRSEQFRDRLRAMNVGGERPDFLPVDEDGELVFDREEREGETVLPGEQEDDAPGS
jgi:hypothetical protein